MPEIATLGTLFHQCTSKNTPIDTNRNSFLSKDRELFRKGKKRSGEMYDKILSIHRSNVAYNHATGTTQHNECKKVNTNTITLKCWAA